MILTPELAAAWPTMTKTEKDALHEGWWAISNPSTEWPGGITDWFGPDATEKVEVEDLLGDISAGVWAAGWLSQIDADVWQMVHDQERLTDVTSENHPYCTAAELAGWLARLHALTIDRGWWPIYDRDGDDYQIGRVATVSEAARYYADLRGMSVLVGEAVTHQAEEVRVPREFLEAPSNNAEARAASRKDSAVTAYPHLDIFRGLYDRAGIAEQERMDAAWQPAVDEMERQHADGDYTDEMIAEAALRITGAGR